jgi:rare lipoprotein A
MLTINNYKSLGRAPFGVGELRALASASRSFGLRFAHPSHASRKKENQTTINQLMFFVIMTLCIGCASSARYGHAPEKNEPPSPTSSFRQTGMASYYAKEFDGRKTASGEPFDMRDFTAAHQTLPFNTRVKVTNLSNNRSVVVRINDRGPFKKNRIIDLSYAAAEKIGLVAAGTAEVTIEANSQ